MADVDVIHADGKGFDAFSGVALGNAWVLQAFQDHLPYSALGVVEEYPGAQGTGYRLRQATPEERKVAEEALNEPGF